MARYDVYRGIDGRCFLLDVQADLLDKMNTRVVVPLMPTSDAPLPARRLNPVFEINGVSYMMVTQFVSAIPANTLGEPAANLSVHFDEITNALDMVFQGF